MHPASLTHTPCECDEQLSLACGGLYNSSSSPVPTQCGEESWHARVGFYSSSSSTSIPTCTIASSWQAWPKHAEGSQASAPFHQVGSSLLRSCMSVVEHTHERACV
mmetsp:Transcript_7676/g.20453  ORF Transcript_7676/g.20453 Transcript_7676/m.20453 type:complete len:106 (+) Transcript_7676:1037-1354(+)